MQAKFKGTEHVCQEGAFLYSIQALAKLLGAEIPILLMCCTLATVLVKRKFPSRRPHFNLA